MGFWPIAWYSRFSLISKGNLSYQQRERDLVFDDISTWHRLLTLINLVINILQIISRNIRPRIACICPFHHDWDEQRVAYRNSVKIEIARKPLKFKPHPTYESLLKCLTRK